MKVLIDANPARRAFVHGLEGHDVRPAQWEGLAEYENGDLQMEAERRGFGVLVTKDEDMLLKRQAKDGRILGCRSSCCLSAMIWPVLLEPAFRKCGGSSRLASYRRSTFA